MAHQANLYISSDPQSRSPSPSQNQMFQHDLQLTVCGDGGCGKTSLLTVYGKDEFPTEYIPTVFETMIKPVYYKNESVALALWDTAGQEEYDRLRPFAYKDAGIILICFAVNYPASLANVEEKWFPEVHHFCEGIPIILVANKIDLRGNAETIRLLATQGVKPISQEQGQAVARRIGAKYMETSAISGLGVQQVFDLAVCEAMGTRKRSSRKLKCTIL